MIVEIKKCNNIDEGRIEIEPNKLNIRYGMNGTGKSTLAQAIELSSEKKDLSILRPFGCDEKVKPSITLGEHFSNVKVFNEQFVEKMVFKESTVIENAFDVFIRTSDYEQRRRELDTRLAKLKVDIDSQDKVVQLKTDIIAFNGKLEINANGKSIKNNTNYKAIIKKNNLFNIPEGLKQFTPIISDENLCINWIDWKTKGESFDEKGICPYCSDSLKTNYALEKKVFIETYKKSDAQNLKTMLDLFGNFEKYMQSEKYSLIISCVKEEKEESAITSIMLSFMNEYKYLFNQLNKIHLFDTNIFRQVDLKEIENMLADLHIEENVFNYFSSELFTDIVSLVNNKISEILQEATDIKIAMGKLQSTLKKIVDASKKDINEFLQSAGITYQVGIDLDENGQAVATLQYVNEEKYIQVEKIRQHLSWGERNAFALILFMFYAISENADLIVLDDPISSFDTNKKYAIVHRMFSKQTGTVPRSFYKKTVLMLTHDFEPIIDFGVVGKLSKDALDARFIRNSNGKLEELSISCDEDIKPVSVELLSHVGDESISMVHRIAFLRKYIEHNGIENNLDAYNVLSSLVHGRPTYKFLNGEDIPNDNVVIGEKIIEGYIKGFDYMWLIENVFNEEALSKFYFTLDNKYLKIQIFRALFEINPAKEIKEEDVLVKFINESYHIENDYAYYLDMIRFETVPEYIVKAIDEYMKKTYVTA